METTERPTKGIAVDGYCKGNPGPGGYRGVDIETGEIVFNARIDKCTNNIAEFIGLCHALGFVKKNRAKNYGIIYTDSEIAMAWIDKKGCGTKFDLKANPDLAKMIFKCEMFLLEAKSLPGFAKWKTKEWGEVPADFGHKR